jgi:hypothetical protein
MSNGREEFPHEPLDSESDVRCGVCHLNLEFSVSDNSKIVLEHIENIIKQAELNWGINNAVI